MESNVVAGVAFSRDEAKMTLVSVADRPGIAAAIFTLGVTLPAATPAQAKGFFEMPRAELEAKYADAASRFVDIDGVRVDWEDGFGLVRASNTTPVLVLRFEGHTPEALSRIENDMLVLLRTVKPDAQFQEAAH